MAQSRKGLRMFEKLRTAPGKSLRGKSAFNEGQGGRQEPYRPRLGVWTLLQI